MASSSTRKPLVVVLVVVIVLAVALVVGETVLRGRVTSCVADSLRGSLGTNVDVTLGAKPVLLTALDKKVSTVNVTSDDTAFGPAQGMTVHASVHDIDLSSPDTGLTVGSSSADVDWPATGIQETVQRQGLGASVTSVATDAASGSLRFQILGFAELTVVPTVRDGAVAVDTTDASVLGFGIPTDLVSGIVDLVSASLQQYPMGMRPESIGIDDDGITMRLTGGAYTFPPADSSQQGSAPNCSLL